MVSKLAVTRNESLSDNTQFYVMMLVSLENFMGQSGLREKGKKDKSGGGYKQVSHAINLAQDTHDERYSTRSFIDQSLMIVALNTLQ